MFIAYHQLGALAFIALAVASVSMTITKAKVFAPLREWVMDLNEWLGDLFSCPYCMSHWVALGAMLVFKPFVLYTEHPAADWTATWFALVTISSVFGGWIYRAYA